MSTLVISQEPKCEFEFINGLKSIRSSLTASILKKIVNGFYTCDKATRDTLLGYIPGENAPESDGQTPENDDQIPESDKNAPESDRNVPERDDQTREIDGNAPKIDEKDLFCTDNAPLLLEVSFSLCQPQFYIQLVYKPHFGT